MSKEEFFKSHLIKYTWSPISASILPILVIFDSLQNIILFIFGNPLLAFLFYILLFIIVGFDRYIAFLHDYYKLERILKDYSWDEDIGLYKHKEKENYICTNCLHKYHKEMPVQKVKNGYICKINNCQQTYTHGKNINVDGLKECHTTQ